MIGLIVDRNRKRRQEFQTSLNVRAFDATAALRGKENIRHFKTPQRRHYRPFVAHTMNDLIGGWRLLVNEHPSES